MPSQSLFQSLTKWGGTSVALHCRSLKWPSTHPPSPEMPQVLSDGLALWILAAPPTYSRHFSQHATSTAYAQVDLALSRHLPTSRQVVAVSVEIAKGRYWWARSLRRNLFAWGGKHRDVQRYVDIMRVESGDSIMRVESGDSKTWHGQYRGNNLSSFVWIRYLGCNDKESRAGILSQH